jgi:hypothetical protein
MEQKKCFHTFDKEKSFNVVVVFWSGPFSPIAADERFKGKALSPPD